MTAHIAYDFSLVPGIFENYAARPDAKNAVATEPLLAIQPQQYRWGGGDDDAAAVPRGPSSQWSQLAEYVRHLNRTSGGDESYKVIYLARHGMGVHNVVMKYVGSPAWKEKWSHLDGATQAELAAPAAWLDEATRAELSPFGDAEQLTWADAHLVESGAAKARELGAQLARWTAAEGVPLPESVYTSPLVRCLETTRLVFADAFAAHARPLRPVVKEALRERLTNHTCDRRSDRAAIAAAYPDCVIEPGFAETDTQWRARPPAGAPATAETPEQHRARKQALLEDIFAHDPAEFVALTTHSYAVTALLAALGEPDFRLGEGAMVALLVKGRRRTAPLTAPVDPDSPTSLKSQHAARASSSPIPPSVQHANVFWPSRNCPKSKAIVTVQAIKRGLTWPNGMGSRAAAFRCIGDGAGIGSGSEVKRRFWDEQIQLYGLVTPGT